MNRCNLKFCYALLLFVVQIPDPPGTSLRHIPGSREKAAVKCPGVVEISNFKFIIIIIIIIGCGELLL